MEYYSFRAVQGTISRFNIRFQKGLLIGYIFLSAAIIAALVVFPLYATGTWPSLFLKAAVGVMIALFFGQFVTAMLMLLKAILGIPVKIYKRIYPNKSDQEPASKSGLQITRKDFLTKAALACGGLFTGALVLGMRNRYNYQIHRVQFEAKGNFAAFKGLRIVQISDIHTGSLDDVHAVTEGFRMIQDLHPDLIVFAGDLVNYRSSEVVPFIPVLKSLHAPLGVYSVLGNHDYGDYIHWPDPESRLSDFARLLDYQKEFGWQVLRNEHKILNWQGNDFVLAGVENWSAKARFHKYGDLNKTMKGTDSIQTPLIILLSHDPSHWDTEIKQRFPEVYLTLSGHTHGMQLGVENRFLKWSPARFLYKQWAGLYQEKSQYLYVNRGFGYIGYEGRLGILPEITLLEWV